MAAAVFATARQRERRRGRRLQKGLDGLRAGQPSAGQRVLRMTGLLHINTAGIAADFESINDRDRCILFGEVVKVATAPLDQSDNAGLLFSPWVEALRRQITNQEWEASK